MTGISLNILQPPCMTSDRILIEVIEYRIEYQIKYINYTSKEYHIQYRYYYCIPFINDRV